MDKSKMLSANEDLINAKEPNFHQYLRKYDEDSPMSPLQSHLFWWW